MKTTIITLIALLMPLFCLADQKAITEKGDEVILYDNGTWKYIDQSKMKDKTIPLNSHEYNKSENATFLLQSKINKTGIWIDPSKWNVKKAKSNEAAEYELSLKGNDLYCMIIAEKIEVPLASFVAIAFENAKNAAPDVQIVNKEYRIVNGNKVLHMLMKGTIQGVKFVYFGYYFSNNKGATQVIVYTSQGLFDEFLKEIEEFLNGFVVLQ